MHTYIMIFDEKCRMNIESLLLKDNYVSKQRDAFVLRIFSFLQNFLWRVCIYISFFLKCLIFLCVCLCVCIHVCVHVYFGPHISVLGGYFWLGVYGLLLLVLEYCAMLDDWTGLSWLHSICSSHLSYLCGPESRFFSDISQVFSVAYEHTVIFCYILGDLFCFYLVSYPLLLRGCFWLHAQEWLLGVLRIELVLATWIGQVVPYPLSYLSTFFVSF